jgi:sulfofructose kinase
MLVAGIGQCSLDYLAVIDIYPQVDTKKEVLEWFEQGGGPVATALVALSRLGIPCRFYGVTGDDYAGEKIKQSLINEDIDIKGLIAREKTISQLAFIAIEEGTARRTIFWKRPSGEALREKELGADFLEGVSFLLMDGLMKDVSLYAAKKANAINIPVMLDAGRAHPGMLEIVRLSDYLVASEEFARDLGWDLNSEVLQKEKEKLGVRSLTVTMAERGSITVSNGEIYQIPSFTVKAVDTTGAGDVFHGGYIYGILQGWDIRDTIIFASALAAMKCTKIGGRTGIPELSEVIKFLKEQGYAVPQKHKKA